MWACAYLGCVPWHCRGVSVASGRDVPVRISGVEQVSEVYANCSAPGEHCERDVSQGELQQRFTVGIGILGFGYCFTIFVHVCNLKNNQRVYVEAKILSSKLALRSSSSNIPCPPANVVCVTFPKVSFNRGFKSQSLPRKHVSNNEHRSSSVSMRWSLLCIHICLRLPFSGYASASIISF